MRRLILMRHAKSSWGDPLLDDHERPLAERGLRDAPRMGAWLRARGIVPDLVLCSTAVRARQTCELVLGALGAPAIDTPVRHLRQLYAFSSPEPLLRAIRDHGGMARALMLVGHNEAMHDLALLLARAGEKEALERLGKKFPTAAIAIHDIDIDDWRALSPASDSRLAHLMRPRELRR